jgi:hypothetical protein
MFRLHLEGSALVEGRTIKASGGSKPSRSDKRMRLRHRHREVVPEFRTAILGELEVLELLFGSAGSSQLMRNDEARMRSTRSWLLRAVVFAAMYLLHRARCDAEVLAMLRPRCA